MISRIAVCVKRVMDCSYSMDFDKQPEIIQRGMSVQKYVENPSDLYALNLAIKLKKTSGVEVDVITVDTEGSLGLLEYCLAYGADRAILLENQEMLDAWDVSMIISEENKQNSYDLLLFGGSTVDTNGAVVGSFVAEMLGYCYVSGVTEINVVQENEVIVHRLLEHGDRETLKCPLPLAVSVSDYVTDEKYISIKQRGRIDSSKILRFEKNVMPGCENDTHPKLIEIGTPRPRPKLSQTPEKKLSASDRMRLLISGGKQKNESNIYEGTDEENANKLFQYMKENGII